MSLLVYPVLISPVRNVCTSKVFTVAKVAPID